MSESMWWWKVALHLDEAQLALAKAMAHNVDDPRPAHALYDWLREGQVMLLKIFHAKGLLPRSSNDRTGGPMPGIPMPGMPFPSAAPATVAPMTDSEPQPLSVPEEPTYPEADHAAAMDVAAVEEIPPDHVAVMDAVVAEPTPASPSPEETVFVDNLMVKPGQRHAMLKSLASTLRYRGADYNELESALLAANKERCNPPKPIAEVRAIARWAITAVPTAGGDERRGASSEVPTTTEVFPPGAGGTGG